jgi:hypothetical protein
MPHQSTEPEPSKYHVVTVHPDGSVTIHKSTSDRAVAIEAVKGVPGSRVKHINSALGFKKYYT